MRLCAAALAIFALMVASFCGGRYVGHLEGALELQRGAQIPLVGPSRVR